MKKTAEIKSIYQNEQIGAIVYSIDINKIHPNSAQPRTEFDTAAITRLADSIKRYGLLQPLSIRKSIKNNHSDEYELVAGERRLRACKMLGMKKVPCIVIDVDVDKSAELALVENIIRENLNIFEQARAFSVLQTQYSLTQEEIAAKLSLSQSAVANKLRLLRLTKEEQDLILSAELTERHSRALLRITSVPLRKSVLEYIISHKLNVTESEEYISSQINTPDTSQKKPERPPYTSERLCSNIYKFISRIQKATKNQLTINRRSDEKSIVFTLTVRKE